MTSSAITTIIIADSDDAIKRTRVSPENAPVQWNAKAKAKATTMI